jgi:ABC-type nitrate/sulfonate/bicarbonate transport system permease component
MFMSALGFLDQNLSSLAAASFLAVLTALFALALSGVVSALLLVVGLRSRRLLSGLERLATVSQALPIQVSVLLVYVTFAATCRPSDGCYLTLLQVSLWPTTIALFFPPFVYAARSVAELAFEMKAVLRTWNPSSGWKIWHIYLPHALPSWLTGLRVSSAWAVPALIVSQSYLVSTEGGKGSLGYIIKLAFKNLRPGEVIVVALVATISGVIVYFAVSAIQHFVELKVFGPAAARQREYHWL